MEVTKFDYISMGVVFAIYSALLGVVISLLSLVSGVAVFGGVFGAESIVLMLLYYIIGGAISGFIGGVIFAAVYNFAISRWYKIKAE